MKTNLLIAIATALFLSPVATADDQQKDDHKHDDHKHEAKAGPNGGKILHEVEPHAELFVTKDRKIQMTFLDDHGKAIPPADQRISIICGKRSAPTSMKFEKKESFFLSDKALPKGMNIPTIVRIKSKLSAKTVTIRFNLNLEDCPGCKYLEYACICEHANDDHKKDQKK
ncbi:MAG: hypothetical protein VCA73_03195 [Roseibacillus sp.]